MGWSPDVTVAPIPTTYSLSTLMALSLYKCWDDIGHILSSHTEQNFIQNTFGKELVVYILHDHITEFQSFFSGIVLALILHRSFEVLFQPTEAPGKGGFSRTIIETYFRAKCSGEDAKSPRLLKTETGDLSCNGSAAAFLLAAQNSGQEFRQSGDSEGQDCHE